MILADSGFWLALGNRRDRHHAAARALMNGSRKLPMNLADAWLVILAEDLGEGRIL